MKQSISWKGVSGTNSRLFHDTWISFWMLKLWVSQQNLKGLRHLYDLVESHVRSLKSLWVSPNSYGTLLSSVVLNKLPLEIRLIASWRVDEDRWSLDALLKVVEEEIRARERTTVNSPAPVKKPPNREQATAAALFSGNLTSGLTCCYCGQPHASRSCEIVKLVEDRHHILQRSGRCFVCERVTFLGTVALTRDVRIAKGAIMSAFVQGAPPRSEIFCN